MSAVILLAVEVINIDLGVLFIFVSNDILLSQLGKHGLEWDQGNNVKPVF